MALRRGGRLLLLAAMALAASRARALRVRLGPADSEASHQSVLGADDLQKIRAHAGLYLDKTAHPEFARTLLLTVSNVAYAPILRNWRCHADRLGLDYIVIALDPQLAEETGPERTLLVQGTYFPEAQTFRHGQFNAMSCLKLQIVKDILKDTGFDVVFSDPDNVFRQDPFAPNVSLGSKMRSGTYQYIYQQNHGRLSLPNASDIASEVSEGNTGFYFASGSSKVTAMQALFQAALQECQWHPNIDDQTNFWAALKNVRVGNGSRTYGEDSFACANLCGRGATCSSNGEEVLDYCEMDPWNHATGWEIKQYKGVNKIVTYHANFVGGGIARKIPKLQRAGFWDETCVNATTPKLAG
uniref:Nucleotide-diphospho-sugar transferase domain-containing protein n=1 Tax=Pyrodinium bahamense TaxID=73915 RepID=A0A7S0FFA7_9DINO